MRVLTAVPERWHLVDVHSKSAMKLTKNAVPLSPEREDGRGFCIALFGLKFGFSAGPRGWVVTKYCLAPHPLADSQVSERQIRHFPVLDPRARPPGMAPNCSQGSRELAWPSPASSELSLASEIGLVSRPRALLWS